jgi:hypothetical protein
VSVLRPDNAPKRILTPKLKQEVIAVHRSTICRHSLHQRVLRVTRRSS